MQAGPYSRSSQRRNPGSPPHQGNGLTSTMSTSSVSGRPPRPESNLGKIEESVTNLLRATKELLETLTRWSRGQASEQDVSDVYVKLGSHFNIACRAFTAIGVETADLGNVPEILRTVLESTLSQPEASPQSLEIYLPRIREIIIDLLQGLKRKQKKLASRPPRDIPSAPPQTRVPDIPVAGEYMPPQVNNRDSSIRRSNRMEEQPYSEVERTAPPRTSSLPQGPMPAAISYQMPSEHDFIHPNAPPNGAEQRPPRPEEWPQPPPPPKQDALAALQRGDALERRASRRYSAYHISKLTGTPPGMVPMLPGTPSAVPRARESRESLNAMRTGMQKARESVTKTSRPQSRAPTPQPAIPEDAPGEPNQPAEKSAESVAPIPPPPAVVIEPETPTSPGTVPGPPKQELPPQAELPSAPPVKRQSTQESTLTAHSHDDSKEAVSLRPDSSGTTASSKELTLFLQLGRSVKKVVVHEGVDDLSINSLRLLFISKFSYNPPSGDDFPEIYVHDAHSGIRYELEDMHDIKDRSVLCLNIEVLDEVKRHIDDGIVGLKGVIEGLHKTIESQGKSIQQIVETQDENTRSIAEISKRSSIPLPMTPTTPTPTQTMKSKVPSVSVQSKLKKGDHSEMLKSVKSTQKDIAVIRQTYDSLTNDFKSELQTLRTKVEAFKKIPVETAPKGPLTADGISAQRMKIVTGKDAFTVDSDNLVAKVDDLQDVIEELRKDVVSRGVRPLPRQIEQVSRDMVAARVELRKMGDYLKREKPLWKKLWERELELVCEEQQFFNLQDELYADLQDDLDKASQTFQLVEECTQQQLKVPAGGVRTASRGYVPPIDESADPGQAKDGVLGEIRALRPNHSDRIEAIERAEKMRQQDLEGRQTPFTQELGKFVEENKLKKSGGVMEIERQRLQRDEAHRKNYFKKLESQGDTRSNASDETITTDKLLNSISADQEAAATSAAEVNGEVQPAEGDQVPT
ncbi:Bud site selection protein 6 [Orbilia oligospora]|uniref:Bud site selection protein 6 n=1 Tax=Orbilia oligospora TaxID=2813651 RepID=A0A7C8JW49_ORBOL|nr:Bud site selection protein 6 [Orbilia oligospora]KAF3161355.1 Bud site selection protein 6 [Orbilia oligospora]KAF3239289.1 Bud site selection protein 6 [Orbilia oligospora]KAF3239290.1 Bud site selection protein 6, variant 2 [Orbilia oligospora]KAF3255626.1 Bud site selection protein 6 [Orbilia oligospora]